jgi:hypothetical protein
VHIDRPDEIAVTAKPAAAACPIPVLGFVCVPASGAPARGASFRAGRAQDAGLFGFVGEVVDIASIFPLRHTPIVMSARVPAAHSMRIANEEHSHLVPDTKVDHGPGGFVPEIAHAPLRPATHLVFRPLQLLPAPRVLLAMALLLSELPKMPAALPLEGADATPGHDQRLARVRGDSGQVDFSQVNGGLSRARGRSRLREFDADVKLEAPVPDQGYARAIPGYFRRKVRVVSMVLRKVRMTCCTTWALRANCPLVACCNSRRSGHFACNLPPNW